MGNPICEN